MASSLYICLIVFIITILFNHVDSSRYGGGGRNREKEENKFISEVKKYSNGEIKKCNKDKDCITDSWCDSIGTICGLNGLCLLIPDFPCTHVQKCDDKKRKCLDIPCFIRDECSDNLFCNGEELCTHTEDKGNICKTGERPCKQTEICIELFRNCTNYMLKETSVDTTTTTTTNNHQHSSSSNVVVKDNEKYHAASPGTLWDANDSTTQIAWLVSIIVFAVVVMSCFFLLFLYISCRSKL